MIQANWRIAQPLLANVFAMGREGWSQDYCELEQRKLPQRTTWRVDITGEMGRYKRAVKKKPKESLWMTWPERIASEG
jgi:hypothetical protein